jgi:hypothetical protein
MVESILKLQVDLYFELSKHLFEHVNPITSTIESILGLFFFFFFSCLYILLFTSNCNKLSREHCEELQVSLVMRAQKQLITMLFLLIYYSIYRQALILTFRSI